MNNEFIKRLWKNRGLDISSPVAVPQFAPKVTENKDSANDKVFVLVFAKDPLTNKPMNDLVLSENQRLAPNVREFIKANLQSPQSPDPAIQDIPGIDDLRRRDTESVFDYQQRLRSLAVGGLDYVKKTSQTVKNAAKK